ncbi:MAG: response regulator [Nitrospirae bacterium]|nr:response regulator [Nitrospirota bacterium]MBF0539886.1 response regulator [Nitrospirota bacterium]
MNPNLLLVEDETEQCKMMAIALENKGYNVVTACDGRQALKELEGRHFDLVITDVQMPIMDGIALCLNIRYSYPDLPIIVIFGFLEIEQAIELLNIGANGLIQKPFDIEDVIEKVKSCINQSRLKDSSGVYSKMVVLGELTASIAHELRNAASASSMAVNMLEKTDGESKNNNYIQIVKQGLKRLDMTISHLLNYSKSTGDLKKIHLREFFVTILVLIGDKIKVQSIKVINKAPEVYINANENSLQIIFLNLLVNAIQAMSDNGTLKITARVNKLTTTINVSDTGSGIKEKDLSKIFEVFYTTKGEKGNGLGLPLVKKEILRLKGKISVKSVVNKGSTFSVSLPNLQ